MSKQSGEQALIEWVRSWARTELGLEVAPDQPHLLEDRLEQVQLLLGRNLAGVVDGLKNGEGRTVTACCDCLVTNETQWLRDPLALNAIVDSVIPDRLKENRNGRLSIWSAAASSGQETYSLAMLLDEALGRDQAREVLLLGSDVSARMVSKAIAARYSQMEVGRGLPSRLLLRHFDQEGTTWRVKEELRERCRFFRHNLTQSPPPGLFDVILCRYVLIYFSEEARRRVLQEMANALKPGGVLVLGASEMAGASATGLTRKTVSGAVLYQAR